MKRFLLAVVAAYALGVLYGIAHAAVGVALPVTLTIHTGSSTYVVRGVYSVMTYDAGAIAIEYTSDRVFCGDFDGSNGCWKVLP